MLCVRSAPQIPAETGVVLARVIPGCNQAQILIVVGCRSLDLTCNDPKLLSAHGGHDLIQPDGPASEKMLEWVDGFEKWPWVDFSR